MLFRLLQRAGQNDLRRSTLINFPLFLLSFVFLALVLAGNGYRQWHHDQQAFSKEVALTLENYVQQSGLLAQAGLAANTMFSHGYAALLEQSASGNETAAVRLWQEMKQSFFNLTGFVLFDDDGHYLMHQGAPLHADETRDIYTNIQSLGGEKGMFSLRYGGKGGYYFYTRFQAPSGHHYMFVSRRSYSKLSSIIYNGEFPGFEMLLLDTRDNSIGIREHYYADSSHQPRLTKTEEQQILYRTNIPFTHWDVIALPVAKDARAQLWSRIHPPLVVLATFSVLAGILWIFLRRQERRAAELEIIRRQTEQRADRVLMSIDDALISTDAFGLINYVNPKGAALLIENGQRDFIGESLADVWPDKQALWNRGLTADELELLQDNGRQLTVRIGEEQRILEQGYNPLYEGRRITGIVWLLRDITDAVHATSALEESRSRYKALFEEAGVAHCLLDISHFDGQLESVRLVNINDAAVRMTKARDRQQLLQDYSHLLVQGSRELRSALQRAVDLKLNTTEFELPLRIFSGEQRDFWVNLSLRSGTPGQALMTVLDVTERKKANEKTREREAFWSKVMAAMPDLVYVVELTPELTHKVIYHNRTIGEVLGYPPDLQLEADDWIRYAEPEEESQLAIALNKNRTLEMGTTREATARFRHYDGSLRILKFRDTPFALDKNGKVVRYIGTARDVTGDIEKQERIVESERRYRLLAENMSDVIWATDIDLNFNFVSSSVERILGYKPDELLREGVGAIFKRRDIRTLFRAMHHEIQQALLDPANAQSRNVMIRKDAVATSKNGKEILLELQASPLWNDKGELQGMLGISRDVGEARKIERELQLAGEVFANSNEAILITDRTLNIANINRAFSSITGYKNEEVIGRTPDFLISPERHGITFFEEIGEALVTEGYWQGEIFYQRASGEIRTGWAGVSAIRDHDHEVQSLIIIMSDITERKVIEERIHKLAYFDPLTGLPNRSQMHERLDVLLKTAARHDQCVALLFIDLDRFKPINDSMGHPAGDQVLKQVAQRLRNCTKKQDLVCRIGGDEFTVALGEQTDNEKAADTAVKVAERILHALNRPYILGQREVFISASIGISIYPHDGVSVIELLKNSDMAMYHAKDLGRDNVQFFNEKMNQKAVELLELENDLRHALNRNELELYYQPQYQSGTGTAVAAEALLRWNHPTKGLISPGLFIPIIEDTGLIVPIGQWVLEQACQHFSDWQKNGLELQRIAVNVSARQFKQDDFLQIVKDAIFKAGIRPDQLELELTESILIDDIEHTLEALDGLRKLGVRTAIDDFGTGYSSLNYLKQFPVDTLKIDRSFIQNLPDNSDDAQITRTIIAMAHNLGMGIIAEGVETREQLDFLISARCEEVQGFLFSKPLPQQQFLQLLQPYETQS